MPHSIASKKKLVNRAAVKFHVDLQKSLQNDQKKIQSFYDTVKKLKTESAAPETVVKKINTCMKKYPEFCNRIVGFDQDGNFRFKELEPLQMQIPDTPPARFTNDIVLSVVPWLPFSSVGRLAQSSKWMSVHITQEQVENALKRARERFGKVELVTELSTGKQVLRLFSIDGEMIEVQRLRDHSSVYVMKAKGRVFIGVSQSLNHYGLSRAGDGSIDSISDVFQHVTTSWRQSSSDAAVAWFKFTDTYHGDAQDVLTVSFVVIRGDNNYAAHCNVLFEELITATFTS